MMPAKHSRTQRQPAANADCITVSAPAELFQILSPGLADFMATALPLASLYETPCHVVDMDTGARMSGMLMHAHDHATLLMREFETHGTRHAALRRPTSGKKCPSPSHS